jgi:DNA-binding transcriptional LysR family regulator
MERFYYKKSRLNQLRGFCATVQAGCSARQAAEDLGVEPATIGKQIASLEDDLKVKLFIRTKNHRLKITPEGQDFYNMAVIQLQGVDGLFNNFHKTQQEKDKNRLVIAGFYTGLSYILPKYIKKLLDNDKFKDTKIKLCNIDKQEAFKRLLNNEVDCVLYPSVENEETPIEINKQNIFKLKNVVFFHKTHPLATKKNITKDDIIKYNYLTKDKYTIYDPRLRIDLKPSNVEIENSTTEIIHQLIKYDIGISCMSVFKEKTIENVLNRDVSDLFPKMYYSLFTLKNKQNKDSIAFVIDELIKDFN